MKTTKAIREYIKTYVSNAYKPLIKERRGDYNERRDAVWKAICEYEDEVNQHIRKIIQSYNLDFDDTETFCSFDISGVGLKEAINIDREVRDIREEEDKIVQKILLGIDFGELKNYDDVYEALKELCP